MLNHSNQMKKMKRSILFSLFTLFLLSMTAPQGYRVGDVIADFDLPNATNAVKGIDKKVSLGDYENTKGNIIIFTCNTCPYAIAYEDRIIALHKKYKAKGFPVVAIMPNDVNRKPGDSFPNMKKRAIDKGFEFAYLYDESQAVARKFGARRTPQVYLVEKQEKGHVVRFIGAIDDNVWSSEGVKEKYLEDAVDAILAGKDVDKDYVKAVGCTIKWKK